ncbi:MAG: chemotaxis protein CheW [Planctomycetes bacterium]|nr:chemotaxis protein CheW [Planctomycetota bacterium]
MNPQTATKPKLEALAGKYLTFFLGEEEYGIEILKVQEIIGLLKITPVPNTPKHMRGVINLRGKVIPVVDIRERFGMSAVEATKQTCIIVVRSGEAEIGTVVDRVSAVVSIKAGEIEETPPMGARVDTSCLLGIGKTEGRVRLLLDIERVLADVGEAASSPTAIQA